MTPPSAKVLLVDDKEENLVALEALLRGQSVELLKARSGPQALELLLKHEVALAVLDVQMPEMDGFELAELMRGTERTRHVPIIFVTAGARDVERAWKGYESGAVDFLYKPVDGHALKSKVAVFLELDRQRRDLTTSLQLNEMFVGILGHDLRNPLGAILMGAHVLERQLTDEAQLRTLRRMISSGERMRDMVEQLLDLTRARLAGGLGFLGARQPVNFATLVGRAVEELRMTAQGREVSVKVTGTVEGMGDSTRLLQLFSNLVSNALRHGSKDAPISVEVEGLEHALVVRITNGGTIDEALLPHIFDPFRSGRDASKSQGLGLGLFIARQIAGAHQGSLDVESSNGQTSFVVTLPRRFSLSHAVDASAPRRRVLVVEDDRDVRESLRDALEGQGHEVSTAGDGAAALELLTGGAFKPDLVVLDMMLPVVDGRRVFEAMRRDQTLASIPVIVSTALPGNAPAGTLVVAKPLRIRVFLQTVAQALQGRV